MLAMAQLIFALDVYIVYVALPDIGAELGFSSQTLQWVVGAYAVFAGGFLLLGGRAADLLGRRRIFVTALALYAVSSLAGGLARSPEVIIAARAVQGIGAAFLFPSTLSLINTLFEEGPRRNKALAAWSGAGASGLTLGSLLGGILTQTFGWSAVFFVNVPLAGIVALAALFVIPRDRPQAARRRFDLPGAVTVTGGATLLVYALVQGPELGWTSASVLAAMPLAVALLAMFALVELRGADPLMPPRLLRNRSLVAVMAITFIFMGTLGGLPYFLTVLFQDVHGFTTLETGLAFLVPAVAIATGTQVGERVTTRLESRTTLLIGIGISVVGTALIALGYDDSSRYLPIVPGLIVMGVGQGITWTSMWIAAGSGVAPHEQGVASGMASTTLNVGNAVGLGILIAIANAGTRGLTGGALRAEVAAGGRTAVLLGALGLPIAAGAAFALPRSCSHAGALYQSRAGVDGHFAVTQRGPCYEEHSEAER
ncbi:MFS transporter [Kribbella sp. VKM Ac-2566]|uniref:MFS transporter n=1 Tax=Kribbella sp. VKM Ac-2566 TaxID=2512218 RepID=UPI00192E2338|nr:MFS transporter [Kribbella sp. VKM Ac-2566]